MGTFFRGGCTCTPGLPLPPLKSRWLRCCGSELADLLDQTVQPGAQLGLKGLQRDAAVLDLGQVVFPQRGEHRVRHVRHHPLHDLDELLAFGGGHDVLALFVEIAALEEAFQGCAPRRIGADAGLLFVLHHLFEAWVLDLFVDRLHGRHQRALCVALGRLGLCLHHLGLAVDDLLTNLERRQRQVFGRRIIVFRLLACLRFGGLLLRFCHVRIGPLPSWHHGHAAGGSEHFTLALAGDPRLLVLVDTQELRKVAPADQVVEQPLLRAHVADSHAGIQRWDDGVVGGDFLVVEHPRLLAQIGHGHELGHLSVCGLDGCAHLGGFCVHAQRQVLAVGTWICRCLVLLVERLGNAQHLLGTKAKTG